MNILAKLLLTTGEVARKQFEEVLEFERRAGDVDLKDPSPQRHLLNLPTWIKYIRC